MNYMLFGLSLAVIESLNSLRSIYHKISTAQKSADTEDPTVASEKRSGLPDDDFGFSHGQLLVEKVRAERNVYLAAFSITAMFAIIRLVRVATIEMHLRNKIKEFNGGKDITEAGEIIDEVDKKST